MQNKEMKTSEHLLCISGLDLEDLHLCMQIALRAQILSSRHSSTLEWSLVLSKIQFNAKSGVKEHELLILETFSAIDVMSQILLIRFNSMHKSFLG